MTPKQHKALRITIDYLDSLIEQDHNPTMILISNELENMYQEAK